MSSSTINSGRSRTVLAIAYLRRPLALQSVARSRRGRRAPPPRGMRVHCTTLLPIVGHGLKVVVVTAAHDDGSIYTYLPRRGASTLFSSAGSSVEDEFCLNRKSGLPHLHALSFLLFCGGRSIVRCAVFPHGRRKTGPVDIEGFRHRPTEAQERERERKRVCTVCCYAAFTSKLSKYFKIQRKLKKLKNSTILILEFNILRRSFFKSCTDGGTRRTRQPKPLKFSKLGDDKNNPGFPAHAFVFFLTDTWTA